MRYPTIVVYWWDEPAEQYNNIRGAWVYQRGPYVPGSGPGPYVTVPARIEALEQLSTGTDDDGRELAFA